MTAPLLSAVIPVRNRPRLVCEAIESALCQRPRPAKGSSQNNEVEVIVVDDASTDGTADEVERRFGSQVRLLRMPRQGGPAAARNAGARVATGTFLGFLDSDDLWLPGKLDAECRVLEEFPGAEAVITDDLGFLEGEPQTTTRFSHNGLLAATGGRPRWVSDCRWLWTNSWNGVATCGITMVRSAVLRLSPDLFAEDLDAFEDWELELRLYHHCRVVALPEVWSWVRRFDDGTREGRAVPGRPLTREQEIHYQRMRLKVIERAQWDDGLEEYLRVELERCRKEIVNELAWIDGGIAI